MTKKVNKIEDLGLSPKEKLVVHHIVSGKTAKEAVKLAGYSEKTNPSLVTGKDKMRQAFMLLLDSQGLGLPKITEKIRDGLDSVKIFGTSNDFIEIADYPTRFKYLELLCRLVDVFPEQNQSVTIETMEQKLRRLHGS